MKLALFILAGISAVLGIVLCCSGGMGFVTAMRDTGFSINAPGSTVVTVTKPGDYTLWNETSTMVNGQFCTFPDELPTGATITVTNKADASQVAVAGSLGETLSKGSTRRVSVAAITLDKPGQYEISVTGFLEKRALYLDESKMLRGFLGIMTVVFGAGCLFLALVLGVVGFVMGREKKQALV